MQLTVYGMCFVCAFVAFICVYVCNSTSVCIWQMSNVISKLAASLGTRDFSKCSCNNWRNGSVYWKIERKLTKMAVHKRNLSELVFYVKNLIEYSEKKTARNFNHLCYSRYFPFRIKNSFIFGFTRLVVNLVLLFFLKKKHCFNRLAHKKKQYVTGGVIQNRIHYSIFCLVRLKLSDKLSRYTSKLPGFPT